MTNIESTVSIDRPLNEVFDFLADLNNHQQLMPENIYNWSSTKDEARFTIQNMAKLALKMSSITKDKEIIVKPSEAAPFELELKWTLNDLGDGKTEAIYTISADLNMMMKMIVSGPLQKLVDHEAAQLKAVLSK
ncbi:MAG: orotate phosphoribosyltransferase [Sphingobacteriales bacterium 17-39-43]|uniref:SRPBCC family protein n=1 Tax=Daejeonella sp. TaxID=2805397 RepID=UPI000BD848CE|nr:SRPBCC family protein [Daejeonella sp.]OYX90999.1 MAG: orotate phosphoribosyltransferase [Sphingobacteriia bacterium 35-40-5]OYZ31995.1 MAG: orotate phosphoribosyltransferase [Sphingobacteriales bacterium 16-39-50]OZA25299.1 MAG: orotate phosphoribosyltransferase [Sphingobacteriales bacterium 17-39-43]OZA60748.1 MAG: orotate phosphoribosyltransferase [Sphingobacteriales bacterium 39-40-5]HQS51386.1 SRPBCC family protein [Daejeonella sp.]